MIRFSRRTSRLFFVAFIGAVATFTPAAAFAASKPCGQLLRAGLQNVQVTSALDVVGTLPETDVMTSQGPTAEGIDPNLRNLPRFCRVKAVLSPVPGSKIGVELWLPRQWNGKLLAIGGHGYAGNFEHADMAMGLHRGYAVVNTDGGHSRTESPGASFAVGNDVALDDFAWRAVHKMTVAAKELVRLNYGTGARLSYFNGCSTGGRQGLREAQQFPDDYDGIISGGAPINWGGLMASQLWQYRAGDLGGGARISPAKLTVAHRGALAACDRLDGLADGLIADPMRCRWDPRTIECRAGADPGDCLTAAEAAAVARMYAPIKDPRTGRNLYDGMAPGSEQLWLPRNGNVGEPPRYAIMFFRDLVMRDPNWSVASDDDILHALWMSENPKSPIGGITRTNPDLSAFRESGGKLIQFHGWSDQAMSAGLYPRYYSEVVALHPGPDGLARTRDYHRLFMVPGMGHCREGDGPVNFGALTHIPSPVIDADHDILEALDRWVDKGVAPDRIIATEFDQAQRPQRQMPLCPWPEVATFVAGDANRAESFACRVPAENGTR